MSRHSLLNRGNLLLWCGIILTASAFSGFCAVQYTFYVSPTGSGTAFSSTDPGALPDVIAKIKTVNAAMTGDILVEMSGGWYTLTNTPALDQTCSGRNSNNVIFAAAPGVYPCISGGKKIASWTIHDQAENIWKATAPAGATATKATVGLRAAFADVKTMPCACSMSGGSVGIPHRSNAYMASPSENGNAYTEIYTLDGKLVFRAQGNCSRAISSFPANGTRNLFLVRTVNAGEMVVRKAVFGKADR